MADATARLRKTFKYPTDADSDSLPEALDEEEQETLINTLRAENTASNETYIKLFLLLPAIPSLLYIRPLFRTTTFLPALLALSSLAASAWTLYFLPPNKTGIAVIDSLNTPDKNDESSRAQQVLLTSQKGPVETYLPYLNLALASLLVILGGILERRPVAGVEVFSGFGMVPAFVYVVVLMAKFVMGSVDVGELEGLKYGYKGA